MGRRCHRWRCADTRGEFGGSLKSVRAYDLGALVLNEVLKKTKLDAGKISMVIMGQNYQSGEYVNIARMSLHQAGWPVEIPGVTVDRRCPSGFDAVCVASMFIQCGQCGHHRGRGCGEYEHC